MSNDSDLPLAKPEAPPPPADRAGWLAAMEARCTEIGYFEPLGARHWAWLHDDGPNLIVSFERLQDILARPERLSFGHGIAAPRGWSHLCLISDGDTWFRDSILWGYVDRLVDDAFFDDFDRVLFFGSGTGSHAACAYSVAAPGAAVLALRPRATLDPRRAGWDPRHAGLRRMDFTSRYGYAPDMVEAARAVWLVLDPFDPLDAMHGALFHGPNIHVLRTPWLGGRVGPVLESQNLLAGLARAACLGKLTTAGFAGLWRARRQSPLYLAALRQAAGKRGRTITPTPRP